MNTNKFADLYDPNQPGAWASSHQGLTVGMDIHDFRMFARRAIEVIQQDPDPARRLQKASRLLAKMRKVANPAWMAATTFHMAGQLVKAQLALQAVRS